MSLKRRVIVGVGWLGALRGVTRGIDFVKLILLARILDQSAFGAFAIVTTIVNLLETLTQTGLNFAVIHYRFPMNKVFKTLLIINLLRGILLSILILGSAGFLSSFYRSDELFHLLLIASIIPTLKGLQNPTTIIFYRDLQFHKEFMYRVIPAVIGVVVSFYFAISLQSATGLVYGIVTTAFFEMLFSYNITEHYFKSKFNFEYVKKMFSYTKWLTFSGVFSYLTNQLDNLFVGRFFNLTTLGLYDLAFKLASITYTEITDIFSRVLFPSFSIIKKDKIKMKNTYLKSTAALILPGVAATLAFLLFPEFILTVAFGEEWKSAKAILQILSIYGLIRTVNGPIGPLFLALGKQKILSIADFTHFVLILLFIYPLAVIWGVNGVAVSIVISYILVQPILLMHVYKFLRS